MQGSHSKLANKLSDSIVIGLIYKASHCYLSDENKITIMCEYYFQNQHHD